MNRSDRLRPEDKRDYERVLDRALNSPRIREAIRSADAVVNAEQLRTKALGARATITAAVLPEYRLYLRLRTDSSTVPPAGSGGKNDNGEGGGGAGGGRSSRGIMGAVGFLVPALAAMATIAFLVVGYGLRLATTGSRSRLADGLVTAGWVAAAVAVLAALLGLVGVLVTASRNRAIAYADHASATDPAVSEARETWHRALLDRGIYPFLLDRLRAAGSGDTPEGASPDTDDDQDPGFSSPGFSSPDFTRPPGFSSPDFSSPANRAAQD
ncbi:hypothetical protein OG949_39690 [Streptomyces scopuliridis]|uniref:hypothetical protein n=1 Tax=Streptomyces scopuliridis TaxID=452529 RepID=UPI002DD8A666|nr:hypothetical protein [Streptomyces scopuliridis]WSB38338.1 hypothetical protein OG949_39690 [Streptomyces scopuliridis]